jgi:guanylate kinase
MLSFSQGQEIVAEQALQLAAKEGHWVVLQVGVSCLLITKFAMDKIIRNFLFPSNLQR